MIKARSSIPRGRSLLSMDPPPPLPLPNRLGERGPRNESMSGGIFRPLFAPGILIIPMPIEEEEEGEEDEEE